jgi:hypothetical protein
MKLKSLVGTYIKFILSILVIWLGVGVSVARCLHTDSVTIQLSSTCQQCPCSHSDNDNDDDDDCCPKDCMEIHHASISKFTIDNNAPQAPLLNECTLLIHTLAFDAPVVDTPSRAIPIHGVAPPPRLYLNLLTTLII